MPSALLTADNDYAAPPAPEQFVLDRAKWNGLMAGPEGIGVRLRALEAKRVELQDIIDDLRLFGLDRLNTAIVPLIQDTEAQIATLQQLVQETIGQNGQIIETFQQQIAQALQSLNDDLAALQEQIDLIIGGGIPAANVAESATRVFVTPGQRDEIEQLRIELDALVQSLTATFASISQNKQSTAEKNQPNGYAGLDANGKVPEARVPQFLKEDTFLATGTWTKDARAKFVIAEVIGPGGGGGGGAGITSSTQSRGARGASGGEVQIFVFPASALPATVLVEIGAPGVGGAMAVSTADNISGGNGTVGGDTRFGNLIAKGGVPGQGGRKWTSTQSGSSGSESTESPHNGGRGGYGSYWSAGAGAGFPGTGLGSGGGAGGDSNGNGAANGGAGYFGNGGNSLGAISERAGKGFGGGGAGGNTSENGGNGAPARVRVSQI